MHNLARREQVAAVRELRRSAGEDTIGTNGAAAHCERRQHRIDQPDVGGTDRSEIALAGEVRPLAEVDTGTKLGNEEVQVGVTLSVCMCPHVDWHAVDEGCKIGAVIEIETTQQILVSLAFARMRRDGQSGDRLEQLPDAIYRPLLEFLPGHRALTRRLGDAEQIELRGGHDDFSIDGPGGGF